MNACLPNFMTIARCDPNLLSETEGIVVVDSIKRSSFSLSDETGLVLV